MVGWIWGEFVSLEEIRWRFAHLSYCFKKYDQKSCLDPHQFFAGYSTPRSSTKYRTGTFDTCTVRGPAGRAQGGASGSDIVGRGARAAVVCMEPEPEPELKPRRNHRPCARRDVGGVVGATPRMGGVPPNAQTSETHPIRVSWVVDGRQDEAEGNVGGKLGLCFCPGKQIMKSRLRAGHEESGRPIMRDLAQDLRRLHGMGIRQCVCQPYLPPTCLPPQLLRCGSPKASRTYSILK